MRRGLSTPAVTVAFVSTLLLLGIVGFSAGYVAAGDELEKQAQTDTTTSPQASKPPTSSPSPARPTNSPTPAPTGTPTRADAFDMPDLVNKNFRDARNIALSSKLGVNVVFNERALLKPNGTVVRTNPDPGVAVWPGVTIQLYVVGPPPKVQVPEIIGKPCHEGKDTVLDAGLKISGYPSGERGNVNNVEPGTGTTLNWNDAVKIFCS